ncbi:CvpA family protein [Salinicoccus albus]|uniref:CvpA family protein n=1 Tax=Salinicoccus albus TaxID=418756 RepID=UPI00037AC7FB|nr:CvpA family protein [Salinicoccus albus]
MVILILLIIGLLIGYRRGIILQSLHLLGTISAIIIAAMNYDTLSARFDLIVPYPATEETLSNPILPELNNAEYAFYDMAAFFIIFIISKIIIQLIVSAFDYLQQINVLGIGGDIAGAVFGLIEIIYIMVVLLFMAAVLPFDWIQTPINDSGLAQFFMDNTFILSDKFIEWLQTES